MPNTKISDFPAASALTGSEMIPVVQSGVNKRTDPDALATFLSVPPTTVWGDIIGTLSDQTDLQTALDNKQDDLGYTPEDVDNKSQDIAADTGSATKYPSVQAVEAAIAAIPGGGFSGSILLSGGGVAWISGLDFIVSAATYLILGNPYSSPQTSVTLDDADATYDRIDVIAVDANSSVVVITGTPSSVPSPPDIDIETQLALRFVIVPAGATEPDVQTEDIYLEDTEWDSTTNSGNITLASTNNPYAGTYDIEGTSVVGGNNFLLTKPSSGTVNLSEWDTLVFYVRSKASWPSQKALVISWFNSTTLIGSTVALKHGTYGFDSTNTTSYQQIAIPTSAFATGTNLLTAIRFQCAGGGSSIGFYVDDIKLQASTGGGGGGGVTTFLGLTDTPSSYVDHANKAVIVKSDATGLDFSERKSFVGFSIGKTDGLGTGKVKGFMVIPYAALITAFNFVIDTGTATVKTWKKATGTAKPTSSDSINTSGVSISTGTALRSTTLSDFTTVNVAANDIFAFNIESLSGSPTELTFQLELTKL